VLAGCGLILAFVLFVVAALEWHAHGNLEDMVPFALIGGIIVAAVFAISVVQKRPVTGTGEPWTCASCGAANAGVSRGCVACGEPRP
jgi:hypothetical protein